MEIIILITALVLVVSLYDFFTSRSWQQVTSSSRNEVVFDDRNKEYGAYQIRRDYDRNLIFILLGIVATISIAYGAYLHFKSQPADETQIPFSDQVIIPLIFPTTEIDEIVPPPTVEKQQANETKTEEFIPLTVTETPVNNSAPIQDQFTDGTQAGTTTTPGGNTSFTPNGTQTGTEGGNGEGGDSDTGIPEFVQVDASFPGGFSAMMSYLAKNIKYPEVAVQAGIQGKVTLRFVVGKDGNIENVTVAKGVPGCPECDKEAIRVVKSMPKWKPAENHGKIVKSYFNLPVTFKLQ